jgi:cytoskeletal protein RodZ
MRATLDKLISWTGLLLAVVLLVAGGLLTWASTFIADEVDAQFSAQDIIMPTQEAIDAQVESGSLTEEDAEALEEFAGEALDNGPAAKAYADHYIKAHMNASGRALAGDPVTYEAASAKGRELSAAVAENPDATEDEQAEAQAWMDLRESLFMGNTLRGLLLYGYAFATIGTIAGYAAIAAFAGGAFLLVLFVLGLRHSTKVETTA